MNLNFKVAHLSCSCNGQFQEPLLKFFPEEARISFLEKLLKTYSIKISEIKFDNSNISDRYISFTKVVPEYSMSLSFGADSFGIEVKRGRFVAPLSDSYYKLLSIIGALELSQLQLSYHSQLAPKGLAATKELIDSLVPTNIPLFTEAVVQKGANFTFKSTDPAANYTMTIADSAFIPNGIFFSSMFYFNNVNPTKLDVFDFASRKINTTISDLNLSISD